jgi:toxin ParE1/3/4
VGRVIWHRLAEIDLAEAYQFIGTDSPSSAERFLDAVDAAIRLLMKNPRAGRSRDFDSQLAHSIRSWQVRGFESYLIFYRMTDNYFEIVRLIHAARDYPRLLGDNG